VADTVVASRSKVTFRIRLRKTLEISGAEKVTYFSNNAQSPLGRAKCGWIRPSLVCSG
jgi:hypothetical protein